MARLRYNGLTTTLGAALITSATSVTFGGALTHSGGTAVPTITGTDYIPLTILNSTGGVSEIVYLTAYTAGATTGTILRGQGGSVAASHSNGSKVIHGILADDIVAPSRLFRGAWSSLTELASYDFQTGVPSQVTVTGLTERIANPGGTNAPLETMVLRIGYYNNTYSPYTGSASLTVPTGTTRIRFKWLAPSTNSSGRARFLINNVLIKQSEPDTAMPWTDEDYAVVPGDVVKWDNTAAFSSSNPPHIAYVKFMGTTEPYMSGEYVTYNGKMWRSVANNNASVPGADAQWVEELPFDAETVRDLIGSTLVAGTNVTVTPDDAGNTVTISATVSGGDGGGGGESSVQVFRGSWGSLSQVTVYDFADGTIPAAFTVIPPPYGNGNPVVADGNGDPTSPGKVVYITGLPGGQSSGIQLTVPSGVTAIRWKWQLGGALANWQAYKNNASVVTYNTFANAFSQSILGVVPGDVIAWKAHDTGNNGGQWRLGYIELLVAAEPYMRNQYVTHLGRLWYSTADNNSTTPGSDPSWVEGLSLGDTAAADFVTTFETGLF